MKHIKKLIIIMAALLFSCPNGNHENDNQTNGFDFEELEARRVAWAELNIDHYRYVIWYVGVGSPPPDIVGRIKVFPDKEAEFELIDADPPNQGLGLWPLQRSFDEYFEYIYRYASNLPQDE